jgi:hypothetical protein
MIPFGGDSWTFSIGGDPDINFCVWILLGDGLHVPPFDAHDAGDAGLRAVGLTESNWREWFVTTVVSATRRQESVRADPVAMRSEDDERIDFSELMYGAEPPTPDQISQARRALMGRPAAGRWPKEDQIRVELLRRWPSYMRFSRQRAEREFASSAERHRLMQSLTREQMDEVVNRERRLWDEIQQFRPLPPLHFFTVDYPAPVVEIVPPNSAVLGGIAGEEPSEDHNRLVLEAAKRLHAMADT